MNSSNNEKIVPQNAIQNCMAFTYAAFFTWFALMASLWLFSALGAEKSGIISASGAETSGMISASGAETSGTISASGAEKS